MAIRILVDAHVFDGLHQGSRTYLKGLYSEFSDEKFEVYFAGNDIENLKKEFSNFDDRYFIKLKSKNKFVRLGIEYPSIIKKYRFDYAHFNYVLPLIINKSCRYINTLHDVLFLDFPQYFSKAYILKNKLLFKRSAKYSDVLLTVSQYSKERISKHFKIPKDKIEVTPNAVANIYRNDLDKYLSKKLIKEKYGLSKYILYVSRIEPRKNHVTLIDAFKELELYKKNYTLVFAGKKEGHNNILEEKIRQLEGKNKAAFVHIENLGEDDLVNFYNGADVCVFPSYCEGFGIPPLESACLKTLTICSNQTAMSEFTFFNEMHFNPKLKNELERKLKNALSNKNSDLGHIAGEIKDKYNWNKSRNILVEKLLSDYKKTTKLKLL